MLPVEQMGGQKSGCGSGWQMILLDYSAVSFVRREKFCFEGEVFSVRIANNVKSLYNYLKCLESYLLIKLPCQWPL